MSAGGTGPLQWAAGHFGFEGTSADLRAPGAKQCFPRLSALSHGIERFPTKGAHPGDKWSDDGPPMPGRLV